MVNPLLKIKKTMISKSRFVLNRRLGVWALSYVCVLVCGAFCGSSLKCGSINSIIFDKCGVYIGINVDLLDWMGQNMYTIRLIYCIVMITAKFMIDTECLVL